MFTISITGEEQPRFIRAMAAALNVIAEQLTGLPAAPKADDAPLKISEPLTSTQPTESKSVQKRKAVQRANVESPETATADQSAAIAEAKAAIEADDAREAKKQLAQSQDPLDPQPVKAEEGQPAPEVTVEQLREAASKLNTDELREKAKQILVAHGAKSVTELGQRDNIVRVSALNEFIAAAA